MVKKVEKSIPWIIILAIGMMVVFGTKVALKEVMADTATRSVTVGNATPTIGTVALNGGGDINLTETVTTSVLAITTITDDNGYEDIGTTTGKIYRSGVGTSCTANDNNCYSDSACATSSCSGNSCTATCEYDVWFHADPTDAGTYSTEYWEAWIEVTDADNASTSATSTGVEMNTLRALDLSTGTINYGSLAKGADTGTLTQVQTTTATGNEAIDIYLYGTRMEKDPWSSLDHVIATTSVFEFDTGSGFGPSITKIDTTHYLTSYTGSGSHGWVRVLEIDNSDWTATSVSSLDFDQVYGAWPVTTRIDEGHYLLVYEGTDNDGWSTVLSVNTSTWVISTSSAIFEFESATSVWPAVSQIDVNHFLVAYRRGTPVEWQPGWSIVLEVNTSTWAVSTSSAGFEFDPSYCYGQDVTQIDEGHYLVAYEGDYQDGWASVLSVNTSTWAISTSSAGFMYESGGRIPEIARIDEGHYLLVYRDGTPGKAKILNVNTSTWVISTSSAGFIFDPNGSRNPAVTQMDSNYYLVVDRAESADGWSVVLNVNTSTWVISTSSSNFEFDPDTCTTIDIAKIDSSHALIAYTGPGSDGWGAVLNPYLPNVIPVEYLEYATSGVNYASGTDLTTLATTTLELDMSKPTSHPSTSTDEIYWGLKIPSYVRKGTYYETTTFEAKTD